MEWSGLLIGHRREDMQRCSLGSSERDTQAGEEEENDAGRNVKRGTNLAKSGLRRGQPTC